MFSLKQATAAIASKPEFTVRDRGEYVVIDYNVSFKETFVGVTDEETKILMNLRGTAFDKNTGNIIRLGYHKFFNYGEFPETDKTLDFSQDHLITVKLDGSCIFPLYTGTSGFELGTRAGVTDVSKMATDWMESDLLRLDSYGRFIKACRMLGITPIFEFCSRKNRVVLDYPEDMLVLTGMRFIRSGEYLSRKLVRDFGLRAFIPVVECIVEDLSNDFDGFHQYIKTLKNEEGVVISFPNGHMLKMKGDEYCLKHKALDSLRYEKDVILLSLEGLIDDVLPILDTVTKDRVEVHLITFWTMFYETARKIEQAYDFYRYEKTQKAFAEEVAGDKYKSFLFSLRAGKNVVDLLKDYCKKQCGTQQKTIDMKKFLNFDVVYN